MSLILDALARAERDKQRAASSLPELLQDAVAEPRSGRHGLWFAIAVLLGVIAVLVVLYLRALRPAPEPAAADPGGVVGGEVPTIPVPAEVRPQTAARASSPRAEVPTSDAAPPRGGAGPSESGAAGTASPERAGNGDQEAAASVAALYAQGAAVPPSPQVDGSVRGDLSTDGAAAPVADSRESRTATAIDVNAQSEASGDALSAREAVSPASSDEPVSVELIEETVDIEAVLRDVRAEAAAGALQPHRAPLLTELSQQFRDAVPTIMYLRHDFNPGGVSTVLMNGETLRVGGRTRGVELREILPESAVLRFQGQEFRLRALNSWVNL